MSKIDPNKLLISSDFYSVQGEGISSGIPSYFVRLGNCNLTCGMSNRFLKSLINDKTLADGEIFKGDLELETINMLAEELFYSSDMDDIPKILTSMYYLGKINKEHENK